MAQSTTVRLLGPVRVDRFQNVQGKAEEKILGEVPRFRSRRTKALLGYLAAERRPIARDHLAAFLWPDWASSRGRANLRRDLHNLAQILPGCWESNRQEVAFVPLAGTSVDLYTLSVLETEERWEEAAELLGGEFLAGLNLDQNLEFENWLLAERERWRGCAEMAMTKVIAGHTQRGRYTDALFYARRLLQLIPWNEESHTSVMRLLAWTGRRGDALRQFESCRQILWEELGVQPSNETIFLYHQIQDGELDFPPQLPAFLTKEKARHKFERPYFVGRESELVQLDQFMDEALTGQNQVIFIIGGPGRGKTALLDAFADRAMTMHPDLLVAYGKCNAYSGVGDPFLPYRDVMAMLTGDLEGRWDAGAISRDHAQRLWTTFPFVVQVLLDHGPHLLDVLVPGTALLSRSVSAKKDSAPWLSRLREQVSRDWTETKEVEQTYLFQQVTNVLRTIAENRPLLLILDDIQWADAASISLLFHLGRQLTGLDSKLLMACAYRPEEVALGRNDQRHPLAKVLSEFKRSFGDVWLNLGQTEEGEDRKFVDALLDVEPNRFTDEFRNALFDRTGGHPLFTVELLRAMQDRGDLVKDIAGTWIEGPSLEWQLLPAQVEAVIEERIDRLDDELQDILTIASVEGELFTTNVVAEVRNEPEMSVMRRLSHDLERQHGLVREQEEVLTGQRRLSRYRFGHILYQNYLYGRLGQGERRLLHGEVAKALEMLHIEQLDEMAVQLAQHFYQADDHYQAFHYFTIAAERAARLYESGEAVTHYSTAIQLAERISPDIVSLAKLYGGRGLAYERLGEFDQARTDFAAILLLARAAAEPKLVWRAQLALGRLWASRDHNRARDYFENALEYARHANDAAALAASLNWMGNWYANAEIPIKAVECHQKALIILEEVGDRRQLANTLDLLGMANLLGGDLNSSVQYHNRAVVLFRDFDDRPGLGSCLLGRANNASMLIFLASIPAVAAPDAFSDYKEALLIAEEIGSAPDEAWAYWSLGLLHTIRGHFGRALEVMQKGLHIASELGHREWEVCNRFALGMLYSELFAPIQAREQLDGALILTGELRSPHYIHLVRGVIAGACIVMEDLSSASTCLEEVILPETSMDTLGKRYCWTRRAELALAQGDPTLALDITERLIVSAPGMSPKRVITTLWKLKAEALAAKGRNEEAHFLLHQAIDNSEAAGERFLRWRLHASLARLCRARDRLEEAEKEYSTAQALIDELAASLPDEFLKARFRHGANGILGTAT